MGENKTDSERIAALETGLLALRELIGEKFKVLHDELQRPARFNWTAVSVCVGIAGMICAGALVWLKTTMQPLEMNIVALEKANQSLVEKIVAVRTECVREHQWNWDGHKQRIDTISKNDDRQEALLRLLLGERMESYEKRIRGN